MAFIEPCFGIGHNLSLICQMTSEDIKHHLIITRGRRVRRRCRFMFSCGAARTARNSAIKSVDRRVPPVVIPRTCPWADRHASTGHRSAAGVVADVEDLVTRHRHLDDLGSCFHYRASIVVIVTWGTSTGVVIICPEDRCSFHRHLFRGPRKLSFSIIWRKSTFVTLFSIIWRKSTFVI